MKPSRYPELREQPHLRELLDTQVDMQFDDVAVLLQLPRPGDLDAGCNLTLASLLFDLISGASVMFYRAELAYFQKKRKLSGSRFERVPA